jgi:hypothetical protein
MLTSLSNNLRVVCNTPGQEKGRSIIPGFAREAKRYKSHDISRSGKLAANVDALSSYPYRILESYRPQ